MRRQVCGARGRSGAQGSTDSDCNDGVAALAGCTSPPLAPQPPAPLTAGQSTAAPVSFTGDLRTLIAAAPPHQREIRAEPEGAPDGRADLNAMAKLFSFPQPEPYAKRLGELGFRQGAVAQWELSPLSYLSVYLIQLRDESAARQWSTERRQLWQGEQDTETFKDLNLSADFDNGVQGGWFIGTANPDGEFEGARGIEAIFYRHDIVVHIDLTTLTDDHMPALAKFADEQFALLP